MATLSVYLLENASTLIFPPISRLLVGAFCNWLFTPCQALMGVNSLGVYPPASGMCRLKQNIHPWICTFPIFIFIERNWDEGHWTQKWYLGRHTVLTYGFSIVRTYPPVTFERVEEIQNSSIGEEKLWLLSTSILIVKQALLAYSKKLHLSHFLRYS